MSNNNEEDRRLGRLSSSYSSFPPAPPISNAKSQTLRRRRAPQRDVEKHEPWLFQSTNVKPLPSTSISLPSLTVSTSDSSLFYLDLNSLKSLLPPGSRHRPRSSEDEYGYSVRFSNGRTPKSRGRHPAPPARLEALNLSNNHASEKKRHKQHRKRKRHLQVVRRKALRIDSAKVRPSTEELQNDDTAAIYSRSSPAKHKKKTKRNTEFNRNVAHHSSTRHHRSSAHYAFDYDSDGENAVKFAKPATPLEDLDEEHRQKALIATHLNLTLEEYERLDAAFGNDLHQKDTDDEGGSMTARYCEEFQEFDVDDSGSISPDELRQLLLASGEDMDDAELASVIEQADTDHDGEINFNEFMALMRARKRLLQVANTMGVTGSGPTMTGSSTYSPGFSLKSNLSGQALPPLKIAARPAKRHLQPHKALVVSRPTPSCLRPGSKVDIVGLRRELALSEYGIQELNSKVREGLQWVQQHCPVTSLKAQIFCHRWGMEKVHQIFMRLQFQQLSRAFQKWEAFRMFERNKIKANMFLKCKGSQKLTAIMIKWRRKVTRRKFARWKTECILDARNEMHSAAIEIQRVVRGDLARLLRQRMKEDIAILHIQALIRGHIARTLMSRKRQAKLEYEAASLLQRCYRGYTGKRLAKALFKAQRETLAACRIQRAFRNFQRKELLAVIQRTKLENDCALTIQCSIRCYLARRERKRRFTRLLRERSAVLLQRCVRGFLARRRVFKIRRQISAALAIQCFVRVCLARQRVQRLRTEKLHRERLALERAAAIRIQARWRCASTRKQFLVDKKKREEDTKLERFRRLTSAVQIQSLFRGYLARRRAQRARFEKLKWMNFTLMNSSALKIQAFWRGYHGRLASHLRLQAERLQLQYENEAAKQIQGIARGRLARNELRRLDHERAKLASQQRTRARAAIRIQKVFRGKQARKLAQQLQVKYREEARLALERLVHLTKTRAAVKIQSCARRFLAKCNYLRRKREMERRQQEEKLRLGRNYAAIVIQCAIRRAGARRLLFRRRRDFEKRISMMASEKAHDEIEQLRKEQEAELLKLKLQLVFQASAANEEAEKLRDELAQQREEEEARHKEEAEELARLRLETLMQQREIDAHVEQDLLKKLEAQRLREKLELEKQAQLEKEAAMRSQENEELATLKMASLLPIRPSSKQESEKQNHTLQEEAAHLKHAAEAIQKDQARMKVQAFCMKRIARKRLQKLQQAQAAAMASIHDEEQRLRLQAEQQKELALARLKAVMDDEACAREQEIKELEVQMLERARKEKERIALRNSAAMKIQSQARGYLDRQRVKAIQKKIDKEREDRAKAMQETIDAAEAKVAEAMIEAGEGDTDAGEAVGDDASQADEWVEYWDENAQASYFYNIRTQEASWTRPVATPSAKAMEIVMEATGRTAELEQEAAVGYADYAATNQVDANGYPASAEGYADEYGYYDQYGQYHYYEQNNAAYYAAPAYAQGYAPIAGMQPTQQNYAAAAAANYAFQAAAAAYGQAMMYGNPIMPYGNAGMAQPIQQYPPAVPTVMPAEHEVAPGEAGDAVPPDPWEKFFDQYTGAAYYYNNITGEQYWA